MPYEVDFIRYFIGYSGYSYEIQYDKGRGLKESDFNQILSTFKFLE